MQYMSILPTTSTVATWPLTTWEGEREREREIRQEGGEGEGDWCDRREGKERRDERARGEAKGGGSVHERN